MRSSVDGDTQLILVVDVDVEGKEKVEGREG
jgi:hypothetical protein